MNTVGTIDNLDHDPSTQTAKGSFHGTGISIFQAVTEADQGKSESESRGKINFIEVVGPIQLPEHYSIVPAIPCSVKDLKVPKKQAVPDNPIPAAIDVLFDEKAWLENTLQLLVNDQD